MKSIRDKEISLLKRTAIKTTNISNYDDINSPILSDSEEGKMFLGVDMLNSESNTESNFDSIFDGFDFFEEESPKTEKKSFPELSEDKVDDAEQESGNFDVKEEKLKKFIGFNFGNNEADARETMPVEESKTDDRTSTVLFDKDRVEKEPGQDYVLQFETEFEANEDFQLNNNLLGDSPEAENTIKKEEIDDWFNELEKEFAN